MEDEALVAMLDAMPKGALPALATLALDHNELGDAGIEALAFRLAAGEWPKLRHLSLGGNEPLDPLAPHDAVANRREIAEALKERARHPSSGASAIHVDWDGYHRHHLDLPTCTTHEQPL